MWQWINLYCFIWEVISKTRAPCFFRAYCTLRNGTFRNETKRNEICTLRNEICTLRNGNQYFAKWNLYFAQWKSVLCEMESVLCEMKLLLIISWKTIMKKLLQTVYLPWHSFSFLSQHSTASSGCLVSFLIYYMKINKCWKLFRVTLTRTSQNRTWSFKEVQVIWKTLLFSYWLLNSNATKRER